MSKEELKSIDLSSEKFIVKIADLGFAREINSHNSRRSYVGSPLMMAPEQLITRWDHETMGYDYKIDIWALGEIFFQMLTGMLVFMPEPKFTYDKTLKDLNRKIQEGEWQWPTDVQISVSGFEFLTKLL